METNMKKDSTVKKVSEQTAPRGVMGQTYLVSGKRVALRLWDKEQPQQDMPGRRDYETVGYVIAGRAELTLEGQTIKLQPGDSWLVPAQAEHSYRILEPVHGDRSDRAARASPRPRRNREIEGEGDVHV
jgi:quercetin dioxygenase-like cupin family protein